MREAILVLRRKCARRGYAIARLRVATGRLMRADSTAEKARTTWASAIGDFHFQRLVEGRVGRKQRR